MSAAMRHKKTMSLPKRKVVATATKKFVEEDDDDHIETNTSLIKNESFPSFHLSVSEKGAIELDIPTHLMEYNPRIVSQLIADVMKEHRRSQQSQVEINSSGISCYLPTSVLKSMKNINSFLENTSKFSKGDPIKTRESLETSEKVLHLQRDLIDALVEVARASIPLDNNEQYENYESHEEDDEENEENKDDDFMQNVDEDDDDDEADDQSEEEKDNDIVENQQLSSSATHDQIGMDKNSVDTLASSSSPLFLKTLPLKNQNT